ncbi:MAG: TIGR03943 family protein [Limnothrix sp. RL_2_0]|nr:TIGR03943 family protein [Limnothrix sp. RL_2_0]
MLNFSFPKKATEWSPWLDSLALLLWGGLLLKYAITGQLALLIHPNYFGLSIAAGLVLLFLGLGKLWQNLNPSLYPGDSMQHISLLPQNLGSLLLILVAIAGFIVSPSILASQTAIQRGLTDDLPLTRSQPESFRVGAKPEDRTLLDWIRTLNAYPEPDAYTGQPVKVSGFVTYLPQLPENYVMVSRFVLTCCAVDAYPVGLPVQLSDELPKPESDSWVEVEGEMITREFELSPEETEAGVERRQLVIVANAVNPIPTPKNPYDY